MTASIEEDLLRELNRHDALAASCARGELSWTDFESAYNSFYPRYPLDGHGGSHELSLLLDRYAERVALHRDIWEHVITKVTSAEHLADQVARDAGFISPQEAVRRVQELVRTHLRL